MTMTKWKRHRRTLGTRTVPAAVDDDDEPQQKEQQVLASAAFPHSPAANIANKTFLSLFVGMFYFLYFASHATKYNFILYPLDVTVYVCVCVYVTKFSHIYIKKMLNMWPRVKTGKEKKAMAAMQSSYMAHAEANAQNFP